MTNQLTAQNLDYLRVSLDKMIKQNDKIIELLEQIRKETLGGL